MDRKPKTCREHLAKAELWLEQAEVLTGRGNSERAQAALGISRQHLRLAQAKAGDGSV